MQRRLITVLAAIALSGGAATSLADSTPVGPLPPGPVNTIEAQHGELVALAVPKRGGGRVLRVARRFDAKVLRQVSEAKDHASGKALESRRSHVRVR